jgi:hypothetical protein
MGISRNVSDFYVMRTPQPTTTKTKLNNMNQPTKPEALPTTNCSSSFWDTPETDEAVANAECESDLVMSMRSMEKRMNDAIIEATNAVNDIIRVTWERNHCKQALEKMHKPKCACGEDSTGWVEIKCCNICGLPHKDETITWSFSPANQNSAGTAAQEMPTK